MYSTLDVFEQVEATVGVDGRDAGGLWTLVGMRLSSCVNRQRDRERLAAGDQQGRAQRQADEHRHGISPAQEARECQEWQAAGGVDGLAVAAAGCLARLAAADLARCRADETAVVQLRWSCLPLAVGPVFASLGMSATAINETLASAAVRCLDARSPLARSVLHGLLGQCLRALDQGTLGPALCQSARSFACQLLTVDLPRCLEAALSQSLSLDDLSRCFAPLISTSLSLYVRGDLVTPPLSTAFVHTLWVLEPMALFLLPAVEMEGISELLRASGRAGDAAAHAVTQRLTNTLAALTAAQPPTLPLQQQPTLQHTLSLTLTLAGLVVAALPTRVLTDCGMLLPLGTAILHLAETLQRLQVEQPSEEVERQREAALELLDDLVGEALLEADGNTAAIGPLVTSVVAHLLDMACYVASQRLSSTATSSATACLHLVPPSARHTLRSHLDMAAARTLTLSSRTSSSLTQPHLQHNDATDEEDADEFGDDVTVPLPFASKLGHIVGSVALTTVTGPASLSLSLLGMVVNRMAEQVNRLAGAATGAGEADVTALVGTLCLVTVTLGELSPIARRLGDSVRSEERKPGTGHGDDSTWLATTVSTVVDTVAWYASCVAAPTAPCSVDCLALAASATTSAATATAALLAAMGPSHLSRSMSTQLVNVLVRLASVSADRQRNNDGGGASQLFRLSATTAAAALVSLGQGVTVADETTANALGQLVSIALSPFFVDSGALGVAGVRGRSDEEQAHLSLCLAQAHESVAAAASVGPQRLSLSLLERLLSPATSLSLCLALTLVNALQVDEPLTLPPQVLSSLDHLLLSPPPVPVGGASADPLAPGTPPPSTLSVSLALALCNEVDTRSRVNLLLVALQHAWAARQADGGWAGANLAWLTCQQDRNEPPPLAPSLSLSLSLLPPLLSHLVDLVAVAADAASPLLPALGQLSLDVLCMPVPARPHPSAHQLSLSLSLSDGHLFLTALGHLFAAPPSLMLSLGLGDEGAVSSVARALWSFVTSANHHSLVPLALSLPVPLAKVAQQGEAEGERARFLVDHLLLSHTPCAAVCHLLAHSRLPPTLLAQPLATLLRHCPQLTTQLATVTQQSSACSSTWSAVRTACASRRFDKVVTLLCEVQATLDGQADKA